MSADRAFIDTNIFVYLYSDNETAKQRQVMQSLNEFERFISTQVLNEFCNVCVRKLRLPLRSVRGAIIEICDKCNLIAVDYFTVVKALGICEKYEYSYYDSLMIASALECDCKYLLSEDLSNGQVIQGGLTITNIFV